jgi:L-ascorbate metabolism protein UlaG (beta-lactamase superfamily)
MKTLIKRTMIVVVVVLVALVAVGSLFIQQAKFGKLPSGDRLERIKKSPHFKDGKFENLENTPDLTEGVGYYKVMKEFIFDKSKRSEPKDSLPSQKIDLKSLQPDENVLVWFGHSSYFMQIEGKKILVDPVLSGAASPVAFTTRSYKGSDVYTTDDFPEIDYLFISHDHWDHLDYETLLKLKPKIRKVVTGLGTGAHFEHWGFDLSKVVESDWNVTTALDSGFSVVTTPARHFSGRGFSRNKALWASFVFKTPRHKIFVGGDSGYGTHFKTIGQEYGPFDLVLLECGQYDKNWKYIHMMPEEVVQAAQDLHAKKLMPVHWSKFTLGAHAWDDPILRVTKEASRKQMPIVTPYIGEKVVLSDSSRSYSAWWEHVN